MDEISLFTMARPAAPEYSVADREAARRRLLEAAVGPAAGAAAGQVNGRVPGQPRAEIGRASCRERV